jgi:hypothetical protein
MEQISKIGTNFKNRIFLKMEQISKIVTNFKFGTNFENGTN